jgi:hypothetical protein
VVTDTAGNTFSAKSSNVATLDQDLNEQVTVHLSGLSGPSGGYATEDQAITAKVTDNDNDLPSSGITYTWQDSLDGGTNWSNIPNPNNDPSKFLPGEKYEGALLRVQVSFTDAAGNTESGASTSVGVVPFLTIANNSLLVLAGGSVPLGVSVTNDPDDRISVTISFQNSGANSTISVGGAIVQPSTSGVYTFSDVTEINNGITLTNHGDHSDTLTVTEFLNGTAVSMQTITVTDPPASDVVAGGVSSTIDSHTTLELAGVSAAGITFANDHGNSGTLVLDSSASFTGQISGFAGDGTIVNSDSIDLKDVNFTTAKEVYAGGTLNVTDGVHTANLHFDGSYELSNFVLSSDGHGGTLVIDPPAPPDLTARFEPDHSDTSLQEAHGLAQEQTLSGFPLATADVALDQFHYGNMDLTGFNGHANDSTPAISSFGSDHFQFAAIDTDTFHQAPIVHPLELDLHQAPLQGIIEAAAPDVHNVTPAVAEVSPVASVLDVIHAIHAHTA